ncbi:MULTISPECIES: hypothetical protein [unclassified Endozoicomonas]|uniref:hypothetical protein n=1 Tax=unclassified Endozoicomonas TaxID=2644528 RepID=UPI0021490B4A|nr:MULTISPECIES: hypothetical protein [unclassified Endozoicomonas]
MDSHLKEDQLLEHREAQATDLAEAMKSLENWSLVDLPRHLTIHDCKVILQQSRRLIERLENELREKQHGHR